MVTVIHLLKRSGFWADITTGFESTYIGTSAGAGSLIIQTVEEVLPLVL